MQGLPFAPGGRKLLKFQDSAELRSSQSCRSETSRTVSRAPMASGSLTFSPSTSRSGSCRAGKPDLLCGKLQRALSSSVAAGGGAASDELENNFWVPQDFHQYGPEDAVMPQEIEYFGDPGRREP